MNPEAISFFSPAGMKICQTTYEWVTSYLDRIQIYSSMLMSYLDKLKNKIPNYQDAYTNIDLGPGYSLFFFF